jgi:beta-fructofuranosidase
MNYSRRGFLQTSICAALAATAYPSRANAHQSNPDDDTTLRARLAADPLRPQFQMLPAKNWMNDPNGPIYWKGKYHMFFQYNPNAAVWGDMHWNHAISDDRIRWKHLPVALAPTPGWDDADGCFTGSAVDDRGTATIVYTGVKSVPPERATLRDGHANFREVQCLATSKDRDLRTWEKWKTPVIEPPPDPALTGFRDPFLWRDGEVWYLGVASGLRKVGGRVLLYRSKDLRQWEYLHPLVTGKWTERESTNPVDSGEMWECPDFFALGKKHVLLYSTAGGVYWETGELDPKELVFHSERRGILDHGAYYAQKTQLDDHKNRILWGWITEKRPDSELRAAGWAGCMALPRVLTVSDDGTLEMRLLPELRSLRGKGFLMPRSTLTEERRAAADKIVIDGLAGEFCWQTASAADSTLMLSDRGGTWISVEVQLQKDVTKLIVNGKIVDLPVSDRPDRELRLFVDASVAELICDDRHAITSRIYRKPDGPLGVAAESTLPRFIQLQAWQLKPISPDRLTT